MFMTKNQIVHQIQRAEKDRQNWYVRCWLVSAWGMDSGEVAFLSNDEANGLFNRARNIDFGGI